MKRPYKAILSSIALCSVIAFAQEPATQAPAAEPSAVPAVENASPATEQGIAPEAATAEESTLPASSADEVPAPKGSAPANANVAQTEDNSHVSSPATETEPPSLLEGTELAGDVHGFLKADKSPYLVTGDIVVGPNMALVIEPGVTLLFKPGTGLQVDNGQLVIAGSKHSPVTLRSANESPKAGDWKGITITGDERAEIRSAIISDATAGIAVENGSMNLHRSIIENSSVRGVYARNADIAVSDCEFRGNQVALNISNYSFGKIERSRFKKNKVAILNSELAESDISLSLISENETGLLNMSNSLVSMNNTEITKNNLGVASVEVLDLSIIQSTKGNTVDLDDEAEAMASLLPPAPEISGIEQRPFKTTDNVASIAEDRAKSLHRGDSTQARWDIIGNTMIGATYHIVNMSKNDGEKNDIVDKDTIAPGKEYINKFQVPGLVGRASAYMLMQSVDGETIEFNANLSADSWNHFSPNPVTLSYSDVHNKVVLGDFQLVGGETYMGGLPIFGADYTVSLMKNKANQPLFQLNGFFGEAKRSLIEGDRHPYIYNEYIDDGELQAQRLAYGGFMKWAPLRRFDAKVGVIYANDELEDPLLRDGASNSWTTSDPIQESFTLYADGNWLFFPGDIELNGQIAVGRADTADVVRQRAINKVFSDAGLNVSSFSLLRQLMQNQSRINSLSDAELYSIFGETTPLTRNRMRDSLKTLVNEAKNVQKDTEDDRDNGRVMGLNWGSQNFAFGASLNWNIYKTRINGHIKYVGEDFYSAGSPNQLSDTREFGARLEQDILGFWDLAFNYQINVENAAKGNKTNFFGLSEGTRWGLFGNDESSWFDKHELDTDRTKYIQNVGLDNVFKVNKDMDVNFTYNFEYKTQHRPFQLQGFAIEDGIYKDNWFSAHQGSDSTMIEDGKDTSYVDAKRWSDYMALELEPTLASRFQEKLFKHTWNFGVTYRAFNSIFKVNGIWTYRTDGSEFLRDSLIDGINFSNSTWSKLGYYFGASDYFEQTYPISVMTTLPILQNRFGITTRYKTYNRDDMDEFEFIIEDEIEIPFMSRFLILGLNASFRLMDTGWKEDGVEISETEMDIISNVNVCINHTKKFYTEWFVGIADYSRPDNKSSEYSDIYMGVNAYYVF